MQRLPNTPEGETKPIGFRLPPPMLAMIDREVDALRAASPEGASVTRSTALRALLVELEQRRAADPSRAPTGDGREGERIAAAAAEVRRILAEMDTAGAELRALLEGAPGGEVPRREDQEGQRDAGAPGAGVPRVVQERVQRGAPVAHTAAGGQLSLLTRTASRPSRPSRPSESAEELAALKPRLVAANDAGRSLTTIGREAGVDPACLSRWLKGTRAGVSVASAHKLAAYLATIGF